MEKERKEQRKGRTEQKDNYKLCKPVRECLPTNQGKRFGKLQS